MRVAEVIGSLTLSRVHPLLVGSRWIIGVPYSLDALRADGKGDGEDLVIFDNLGAGLGSKIGFSEGERLQRLFIRLKSLSMRMLHC